jgi:DnaJ-class molecular chaperone
MAESRGEQNQEIEAELERACPKCGGRGWFGHEREQCVLCGGAGYVPTAFGRKVLDLMRHNLRPMLARARGG